MVKSISSLPMIGMQGLCHSKYRRHDVHQASRCILLIYNLAHQGVEPATTCESLGLTPEWYGALEWAFPTLAGKHALDRGEAVNILKGAIVAADRNLTISPGYSWEVTTPEGGYGLHELLASRWKVLNGIVNGIDMNEWDPATDDLIPYNFSSTDLSGKVDCKRALQEELGLPVKPDCPLIGFIGRLDSQKGTDLIRSSVPVLLQDDVQFIMLGSGDPDTENWMRRAESTYRDKFRGRLALLSPSHVGLMLAIHTYRNHKASWEQLMKRGLEKDFSWDRAAAE